MAADTEVIKEFLISLGYHVDENSFKKMVGGLSLTNNAAAVAGKAVLGVAVAAEAMVVQFSSSMEKLYYQSKRTGASVENLQALEFGSQKIGLAAGTAREALESMASALRMSPGIRAYVDGLFGKDTSKMDQAQLMIDLVQKMSEMPHAQGALVMQQMFGMDERTFFMLKEGLPDLIKAEKERIELNRQAGIDAQKAAEAGKDYANSIRDITVRVGVLRDVLAIGLLPKFQAFNEEAKQALDNAAKWSNQPHPAIAATGKTAWSWGESLGQTFRGIGSLDGAQTWAGIKSLGHNLPGAILARKLKPMVQNSLSQLFPVDEPGEGGTSPTAPVPDAALPRGMRNNNPGNMRAWAKGQEKRGGFVVFPTMQSGLSAMAGQLLKYQEQGGLDTIRAIISKWAPKDDRNGRGDHNETEAYIDAVARRIGAGASDKLNLKDPQVLSRLMGAMIQQEQGYAPFGSAELLAAANSRLGGAGAAPVTIHQKTDIHVNGGDSPRETAREVGLVQDETNGNMVRNMRSIVQ